MKDVSAGTNLRPLLAILFSLVCLSASEMDTVVKSNHGCQLALLGRDRNSIECISRCEQKNIAG